MNNPTLVKYINDSRSFLKWGALLGLYKPVDWNPVVSSRWLFKNLVCVGNHYCGVVAISDGSRVVMDHITPKPNSDGYLEPSSHIEEAVRALGYSLDEKRGLRAITVEEETGRAYPGLDFFCELANLNVVGKYPGEEHKVETDQPNTRDIIATPSTIYVHRRELGDFVELRF